MLHEQNAVLGRVNRLLAGEAVAIGTAYDEIDRLKPRHRDKVVLVGNPVRAEVERLGELPFPPFDEFAPLKILVTGGSQGASILGRVVPEGLGLLEPSLRRRLQVVQQCRPDDIERVRARYAAAGNSGGADDLHREHAGQACRRASGHRPRRGLDHRRTDRRGPARDPGPLCRRRPTTTRASNAREMVKAGGARTIREDRFTPERPRAPDRGDGG